MPKIFKCYSEGDKPQNMLFVGINDVTRITSYATPDGKSKLFVDYYDDKFCIDTTLVCENIVVIDPDTDEDFKIWRYS